jgi:CDP-glucose 4,6-dehydratase
LNSKIISITGGTGLLGASLANALLQMGNEVHVLIRDQNARTMLSNSVNKVYGSITDKDSIDYFIQKSRPEIFLHLAAQTQAYDSLRYPYTTFQNNMVGTLNVLESLREYNDIEAIISASSDKAYGELIGEEYFESHPLNGLYPYDASKSITDMIVSSYRATYKLPIVSTRACNIFGPGDFNRQRLIPGIVNSYLKNDSFTIRNGGADVREYIYVGDVVDAYIAIIELMLKSDFYPDSLNISSGIRRSTLEVFSEVNSMLGGNVNFEIQKDINQEIRKQFMNSDLIKEVTSWNPKANFEESLRETVQWNLDTQRDISKGPIGKDLT